MKFGFGIIISILIAVMLISNAKPNHTEIDSMFIRFASQDGPIQYQRNCEKPSEFHGFQKYKVDCLTVKKPGAFETMSPHHNLGYILGSNGFKFMGSQNQVTLETDGAIYPSNPLVYERQTEKPDCNRRVFVKYSWNPEQRPSQTGDKIYIADPYVLYCGNARQLINT